MTYIIVDIETAPHPDAHRWAEPVKADSRLKDAAKITENLAEKQAKQADEFGLDPDSCRIVALGHHVVNHAEPDVFLMRDEFEERQHLIAFWHLYTRDSTTRLVTFNGLKFDLPILMRRSMYLDVPHPTLNLDRYRTEHIDLWQKLSFNGAISAHSLKFYAKRLGIGTLDKVDGADIARLVAEERWPEIEAHCLSDIGLTHALANRLGLIKIGTVAERFVPENVRTYAEPF